MKQNLNRLVLVKLVITLASCIQCGQISTDYEPHLVFSHALGLESLNLTSLLTQELNTNGHNIFDLDLLWNGTVPQLFWSDLQEGRIYSGVLDNGALDQVKMVVGHGISSVEGIAVDWIGHNLYLVESRYGWIEVADLTHRWRSVVVTNIEAPRALALDSRDGLLFWTDRSANRPKIERSSMSGRGRVEIVDISSLSEGGIPNGLTIDYVNRQLYWIDAKSDSIYTANYDGQKLQKHYYNPRYIQSPFGLSFHNEDLFWVDAKLNTINKINIRNGSVPEVLYKTYHSLYGVIAIHQHHHPESGVNPCLSMGCSHLCLLDDREMAVCRCPQLMTLGSDGKRCQEVEEMILVSEFHQEGNDGFSVILGLSDNNVVQPLTFPIVPPSHTEIVGLDLDEESGYIYWADATSNAIWKASVLGDEISKEMYLGYGRVTGFGANWKNSTIYYSSVGNDRGIFSCSIKNNVCVPVVVDGFHEPQFLALHSNLQQLFWLENEMGRMHIVSSNLDGSNVTTVYNASGDRKPDAFKSFTLDPMGTDLYWIDSEKNEILHHDMIAVRTISKFNSSFEINTLLIDKERILVSDSIGRIHALDKSSGNYLSVIYNSSGTIRSLRPVKTFGMATHLVNPCAFDNGGCSDQCVYEGGNVSCLPWPTAVAEIENLSSPNNLTSTAQTGCHMVCQNGGQCQREASGRTSCKCKRGNFGHLCQFSICKNHCVKGQCYLSENDKPLCLCPDGYYGQKCENSICHNFCHHGRCQYVYEQQRCVCNEGWAGPMCQVSRSELKRNSNDSCALFCLNEGKCEVDESGSIFRCSCPDRFSGERCELVTDFTASGVWLVIVSIGWSVTLVSILVLYYRRLLEWISSKRRGCYETKHNLLVDYNSNGPSEHAAVYNVRTSPPSTPTRHFLSYKRSEVDDRKPLTETEELNEPRTWNTDTSL